jgi:nucleoside-triphosphatase
MIGDTGQMRRHFLITGSPGVGKTTLIVSVIARLPGTKTGFFTREVREDGVRTGFMIETLDGVRAPLADVAPFGSPRVGKYRVLLESIREVAVPAISGRADFIIIDEIGKMESTSESFVRAVHEVLAGSSVVIATIAGKGNRFIEGIKQRSDVLLFEVTRGNRDRLAEVILQNISATGSNGTGLGYRPTGDKTLPER